MRLVLLINNYSIVLNEIISFRKDVKIKQMHETYKTKLNRDVVFVTQYTLITLIRVKLIYLPTTT